MTQNSSSSSTPKSKWKACSWNSQEVTTNCNSSSEGGTQEVELRKKKQKNTWNQALAI